MTKETRFKLMLDDYEAKKAKINQRYTELMELAPVNEAGEVPMSHVLDLNAWHTQESNMLANEFWAKVKELMK